MAVDARKRAMTATKATFQWMGSANEPLRKLCRQYKTLILLSAFFGAFVTVGVSVVSLESSSWVVLGVVIVVVLVVVLGVVLVVVLVVVPEDHESSYFNL